MPAETTELAAGRAAFSARRWSLAAELLAEAEAAHPLAPADYESFASAKFLISPDEVGARVMGDASQILLDRGDPARAAMAAFWAGSTLNRQGELAAGSGWIGRGVRILDEAGLSGSRTAGYLQLSPVFVAIRQGDAEAALALVPEVLEIAQRCGDADLAAFARHLEGRARILRGEVQLGLAMLDEAMVAATTGDMSPLLAGLLFCSVLATAQDLHEFGRAREWARAIEQWCALQPDLEMYRGECRVFHARVLRIAGDWPQAEERVASACVAFLRSPRPHHAAALALYEQGELYRLTGRYQQADAAFTQAAALGHAAQPGVAQLRLGQGRQDAAAGGIRRALTEASDPVGRAAVLPAAVEIFLAVGALDEARGAAVELAAIGRTLDSEYLEAQAAYAKGAVLLASGDAASALPALRDAASRWSRLDAAYGFARTRLLIGEACAALGDADAARTELEGAIASFERLGAGPDLQAAKRSLGASPLPLGLTKREVELLALLATGKTNREIGATLFISEKTVARHVSNIFNKLGVSSRSAATAVALKHGLA